MLIIWILVSLWSNQQSLSKTFQSLICYYSHRLSNCSCLERPLRRIIENYSRFVAETKNESLTELIWETSAQREVENQSLICYYSQLGRVSWPVSFPKFWKGIVLSLLATILQAENQHFSNRMNWTEWALAVKRVKCSHKGVPSW